MMAALAVLGMGLVSQAGPAHAQTVSQRSDAFTLSLPLLADGRPAGALLVETTVTEVLALSPDALANALSGQISDEAEAELTALGSDLQPVGRVEALGYLVELNPQTLAIEVELPLSVRAAREESLSRSWLADDRDFEVAETAAFGVTGALQVSDVFNDDADPGIDLGLDGFANLGGIDGISLDWGGRFSVRNGEADFQRNRLFLFHDRPDVARRYSAGDLSPQVSRDIGVLDLLGVSMAVNHQDLQPTRNIRPTGDRSLLLERRSTVEVYVNGTLIDRFTADPGPVDLRDIPLANVSNQVSIVVEDALGRREVDSFALSADISLLEPGLSESVFAAGFRRRDNDGSFEYDFEAPVVGGQISRGLTNSTTVTANMAATPELNALGGAIAQAMFGGVAQLDVTYSHADAVGEGVAAGVNFRGGPYLGPERYGILNLRINFFGEDFATLNDFDSQADRRWSAGGDFRVNLTDRTAVSLGVLYQDDHAGLDRSSTLSLGVNRRFGEIILAASARHTDFLDREDETGIFLTLSRRIGARQLISSSYDSLSGGSRLEYRALRDSGLPTLSARASVFNQDNRTDIRGQLAASTTRFGAQLNAGHSPASQSSAERNSISIRLQSGLAYADGVFGIGRDPGRGFVMVDRHASLDGAEINVSLGSSDRTEARADILGPAVVPLTSPYRPQDIRIGARNLEPGYYIGPGRYTILPGALTGLRLTVGTDAFRTAVATIRFDGEAQALKYGEVEHIASGRVQNFFTNRAGRAAFNELIPGQYRARLPGGLEFDFLIDEDAPAYINLGEIDAERGND